MGGRGSLPCASSHYTIASPELCTVLPNASPNASRLFVDCLCGLPCDQVLLQLCDLQTQMLTTYEQPKHFQHNMAHPTSTLLYPTTLLADDHKPLPFHERSVTKRDIPAASAPPPPGFSLPTGASCLERAARERWAPPAATSAGYDARAACPGLAAARAAAMQALGWQVERVRASTWWGEGGAGPSGQQQREARLRAWLAAPRGTPYA